MPEMRASFRITVGAFLFDPHRARQHQIGGLRGYSRIGVGHDDEILGIPVAGICFFVDVGCGLKVVVDLNPIGVELAIAKHAVLQHGVVARLRRNRVVGQLPDLLGLFAMLLVGYDHVCGQPV